MMEVDFEEACRNEDGIPSFEKSSPGKEESEFCLGLLSSSSSSSSSSDDSTQNSVSDSPPNFMKTTTSSEARRNHFQKSSASCSGSKTTKNLARMSSSRFRSTLIRKSSDDRGESQSSVSSRYSKLENRNTRQKSRDVSSVNLKSNSMISRILLTRKPSLKPVRKLVKLAASKSKKCCNEELSEFPIESCVEKATCSSALKGSKFPENIELQPGEERQSEKLTNKKICPYSYCSLHGHSHRNAPPLKRFKSIRKRALRAQKNKSENEPVSRAKRSGNTKEGVRASKMADGEGPVATEMMNARRIPSAGVGESGLGVLMDINSKEASDVKCKDNFDTIEYNSRDSLGSSVIDYEQMGCESEASGNVKGDLTAEIDSLSRTSSSSSISLNITAEVQEINPKYIRMWQLVFKNVVDNTSNNADNELPRLELTETSKEVGEKSLGETNSSSFKLLSNVDQEGTNVSPDTAAYRKLELFKKEAVKLVQEAFDRILLPEIQDQSPRTPDETLGGTLFERIQREERGPSLLATSSGTHSAGEDLAPDSEKTLTKVENIASVEEKKTVPRIENMPNQSAPKRWSNLKKLILLKRFVKALEKVRKINPQKPRYLPFNPETEGESVHLQHQMTEERKNSEEWMLDYAIQQVISKLEPAKKKRVSLLIEAFETVLPPGVEAHISTKVASPIDPCQVHGASDEADKESRCRNGAANTLIGKLSKEKNTAEGSSVQANIITDVKHQNSMTFFDRNEANLEHLEKSEQDEDVHKTTGNRWRVGGEITARNLDKVEQKAIVKNWNLKSVDVCLPEVKGAILESETSKKPEDTSYQEVSVNGKLLKVSKRVISHLNSELQKGYLEPNQTIKNPSSEEYETSEAAKRLTFEDNEKSAKVSDSVCSSSANELLEKTRAAIFHGSQTALPKAGSTQEESVSPEEIASSIEANETRLEEKKNASMWFLIYKHMVSSTDDNHGSKPLVDEIKDEKKLSSRKQNEEMEDRFVNDPAVELQCIEAVKLVNEAIDEIPEPDNTSPHDQSFSADSIADQALFEEEKRDASTISERRREELDPVVSYPDEDSVNPVHVTGQGGEKEPNLVNKPNQQVLKNWSNLKKVILLKRFIKAMEKVKKFNPRRPNFLPLSQDPESEKVQLRHQDSEDRKNAEEWMLDYALQQAVAKLTPARKRKVELLVQAFETVNPTIRK